MTNWRDKLTRCISAIYREIASLVCVVTNKRELVPRYAQNRKREGAKKTKGGVGFCGSKSGKQVNTVTATEGPW